MTVEPLTIDNMPTGVGTHSTTIAALAADIEALTAAKDDIRVAHLKEVFESVIDILGLVRVRVPFCSLFRTPLDDALRTR